MQGIYWNCKSHKVKQLALWIQSIPLIIIELMRLDGECLGLGENYCRLQCFWIFNWFARKFVINWIDLDRDGLDTRNMGIIWLRIFLLVPLSNCWRCKQTSKNKSRKMQTENSLRNRKRKMQTENTSQIYKQKMQVAKKE